MAKKKTVTPATKTKKAKAPAKKASPPTKQKGAGRPKGHPNYTPPEGLSVRDTGKFKGYVDGIGGPRWIRVYAGSETDASQLLALQTLVETNDAALTKLLNKKVKELSA